MPWSQIATRNQRVPVSRAALEPVTGNSGFPLTVANFRGMTCKILDLIYRSMSDFAIHRTASEAGAILSRMRSTGFADGSEAGVLDRIDPLAKLAAKR
jgi:hypothetical protein